MNQQQKTLTPEEIQMRLEVLHPMCGSSKLPLWAHRKGPLDLITYTEKERFMRREYSRLLKRS